VDEVNAQPIDAGRELRERIQLRFHLAPVIACNPVLHESLEFGERGALRSICGGFTLWPPRGVHASAQVGEVLLASLEAEGSDLNICSSR
jgi:hypothetical protein